MDVFLAYTPDDEFELLKATMEAWAECDGANVSAIFISKKSKFELLRRITADNLSSEKFYILADLGCVPSGTDTVRLVRSKISDDHGLVGLKSEDSEVKTVPEGVRICQKGAISRWATPKTGDYNFEHMASALKVGKKVEVWDSPMFKHVGAS